MATSKEGIVGGASSFFVSKVVSSPCKSSVALLPKYPHSKRSCWSTVRVVWDYVASSLMFVYTNSTSATLYNWMGNSEVILNQIDGMPNSIYTKIKK